jgi:hypothetical protein
MTRYARVLAPAALLLLLAVVAFPDLLRFLPIVLLAACPLSMILMGHGAHAGHAGHAAGTATLSPAEYTCPMHPDVGSSRPGRCPKCGMALIKAPAGATTHAGGPNEVERLQVEMKALAERQAVLASELHLIEGRQAITGSPNRAELEAEEVAREASRELG